MSVGDTAWCAIVQPGGGWETGQYTYTGANTLARTTVISSSNAGALVSFTAGSKDVFMCQPGKRAQEFPSGTLMLFQQTFSPPGWTKQTTHNDKALRVVSGTPSFGGGAGFSAWFNNTYSTGNTTITVATMPNHNHTTDGRSVSSAFGVGTGANDVPVAAASVGFTGGDGTHSHVLNFNVAYVDLIISQKV